MAASVKRFYNLKKHLGVVSNARLKKDTHPEGAYFAGGTAELVFFFFFFTGFLFFTSVKTRPAYVGSELLVQKREK